MNRSPGRPPRASKASTDRIEIRVTAAERKTWARAATRAGLSLSDWMRGWLESGARADLDT